jgi:hypothetical protein
MDDLVGSLSFVVAVGQLLHQHSPGGVNGMVVVLHSTCGDHYTYQLDGPDIFPRRR